MDTTWGLAAYLAAMIFAAAWMARHHRQSGAAFMRPLFTRRAELGEAANQLVVVGMTLFGLAVGALLVQGAPPAHTLAAALELASDRLGAFLLILAAIHLVRSWNLFALARRAYAPKPPRPWNPPIIPPSPQAPLASPLPTPPPPPVPKASY